MAGVEEVSFSLKVMVNKEKTKVLFAESDSHFVDVLLSFLALPLGRIVKILEKHYEDEPPIIGCLNTFYNSIANLDGVHFWTEGAKMTLLDPTTSFDVECHQLKLDVGHSHPEIFFCGKCLTKNWFRSVSKYYDKATCCSICNNPTMIKSNNPTLIKKESAAKKQSEAGVFTQDTITFIISDDMQISPNAIGLVRALSILDTTGMEDAVLMNVAFGLSEIINLLKASTTSHSPLSDLILNKTRQMNSVAVKFEKKSKEEEETPNSKKMILIVTVQKLSNRLLFAQARVDFVEFLLSLLAIPLGGVESLLSGETCMESIDNLYRSVSDLIDDEYFVSPDIKRRLMNPKLPHGYVSENQILPLTEESLPDSYKNTSLFSCLNFPKGKGNYIKGRRTYQVLDDLTVTPFYISSVVRSLNEMKIPVSNVKELEIQFGLEEALGILKASLTSNSALTNGLWKHLSDIQPKQEI